MAEDSTTKELSITKSSAEEKKDSGTETTKLKKKKKGFLSRLWNGMFGSRGDDFEKRLQYISKEEASVLARVKRRTIGSKKMIRNLIIFSVFFEVIAVGYAIMTTRSLNLDWKMRGFRVLPMFLLPFLSYSSYSGISFFTRIWNQKDQKTLERLREERQSKIDELKRKTNYYITQQLIQRYDPDPAAKAAAASVLASKLGYESGIKVYLEDDTNTNASTGKSNDFEYVHSTGLRNRKQQQPIRSSSAGSTMLQSTIAEKATDTAGSGISGSTRQVVVEHHHDEGASAGDGGWISRIAALLVGEDPTQSYALICGNCHMHNGLARKEEYPYITYYCPHCRALNKSKQLEENVTGTNSPITPPIRTVGNSDVVKRQMTTINEDIPTKSIHDSPAAEILDETEVIPPTDSVN